MRDKDTSHPNFMENIQELIGLFLFDIESWKQVCSSGKVRPEVSGIQTVLANNLFSGWRPSHLSPTETCYPVWKVGHCDRSERLKQGRKCSLIITGSQWDWRLECRRIQYIIVLRWRRAILLDINRVVTPKTKLGRMVGTCVTVSSNQSKNLILIMAHE